MIRITFVIYFVLSIFSSNLTALGSEYKGDIYDAHAHLPKGVSATQLKKIYQEAGIKGASIFVKPFEKFTLQKLKKEFGENFLIFVDVHKRKKNSYKIEKKRVKLVGGFYESGLIAGLGEIYVDLSHAPFAPRGIKSDITTNNEATYLKIANKLSMPIHVHHESADKDFENIIKKYSNIKFILSHCGYLNPGQLDKLMKGNKNLFADLSLITNRYFGPFEKRGVLITTSPSEAWLELLTKHSDRFMVGSDIGANLDRAKMLPLVMRDYRMLLGNLPPDVAKKIASENYLRIFQ